MATEPRQAVGGSGELADQPPPGPPPGPRACWVAPMLAARAERAPSSARAGEWLFQQKLDGLRAIAVRNGDEVQLWSRSRNSFGQRFGAIAGELRDLPADSFVLDGEIVAFEGSRTSFGLLQAPGSIAEPVYMVFDVLHLLGHDTTRYTATERHRLLTSLLGEAAPGKGCVRLVECLEGDPVELLERACQEGWEGIVAKRAASAYRCGRSSDWLKLKCTASQELVIGGFTEPEGSRRYLGALLLGYYDDGQLRYAGKVGTGFDEATLRSLHARLSLLVRDTAPFSDPPREKRVHWVEPELVAEVMFGEWTADGRLRHPRFGGLREDKPAREVAREPPRRSV